TWVKDDREPTSTEEPTTAGAPGRAPSVRISSPAEWGEMMRELERIFRQDGARRDSTPGAPAGEKSRVAEFPLGVWSALQQDEARFYAVKVTAKNDERIQVGTMEWGKEDFSAWWAGVQDRLSSAVDGPRADYRLPIIASGSSACVDDTWTVI